MRIEFSQIGKQLSTHAYRVQRTQFYFNIFVSPCSSLIAFHDLYCSRSLLSWFYFKGNFIIFFDREGN